MNTVNVHLQATATYEFDWEQPGRPAPKSGSGPWYLRVSGAYGPNSIDARGHSLEGALQTLTTVAQQVLAPQPGSVDDRFPSYKLEVHIHLNRITWPGRQGESDPQPVPLSEVG